jgi:hypothetical protein
MNDTVDAEEDLSANDSLAKKMRNVKPRKDIYLPLMKDLSLEMPFYIIIGATYTERLPSTKGA